MNKFLLDCISYIAICGMLISSSIIVYIFVIHYNKSTDDNPIMFICPENSTIVNFVSTNNLPGYVVDRQYSSIEKDEVQAILDVETTNEFYQYKQEVFDCDEFSVMLLSTIIDYSYKCELEQRVAFGLVIGRDYLNTTLHMMNFFIDRNLIHWCVEPQDDSIVKCDETGMEFTFLYV